MNLVKGSIETIDVTLVEKEKREFKVMTIQPYNGKYRVTICHVNINSPKIDKDSVCVSAGMLDDLFPEELAAACVEYYGERFWGGGHYDVEKAEAIEILNKNLTVEVNEPEEITEEVKKEEN